MPESSPLSHSSPLEGSVVCVTGSSSGIGHEIALAMARQGASVVVHYRRNAESAAEVVDKIEQLGQAALALQADIRRPGDRANLIEQAWNWRDGIDVWVNNAGADVLTGEAADWEFDLKLVEILEVDVQGTIHLSRAIGERMRAAGAGAILNIGWDQAAHGMAGDSGEMFAASKGAIMAFSRSLAQSLAPQVRVNCIAPGWIRTRWGEEEASDHWSRRAVGESLVGRWGEASDVAELACFLASPAASFINGQVIAVNGGWKRA